MILGIMMPPQFVIEKGMLAGLPALLSDSDTPCKVCWELDEHCLMAFCGKAGLPAHMAPSMVEVSRAAEDEAISTQQRVLSRGMECAATLMVDSKILGSGRFAGFNMEEVNALALRLGGDVASFGAGATIKPVSAGSPADQSRPLRGSL